MAEAQQRKRGRGSARTRITPGANAQARRSSIATPVRIFTTSISTLILIGAATIVGPAAHAEDPRCNIGFVWREATPEDKVCVRPEIRTQTANENALGHLPS